jgi:predicted aminopeptidase
MAKKLVNNILVDMTPQEEAAFEASRAPVLSQIQEQALQKVALRWAGSITYRRLLDFPNPNTRLTAMQAKAKLLADDIKAATTVAQVLALDLTSGWD